VHPSPVSADDLPPDLLPNLPVYLQARQHLDTAVEARDALLRTWNRLDQATDFDLRIRVTETGGRELWAEANLPERAARELDRSASEFLHAIKSAADAAVLATAQTVCTPLWPVDPELHRMPLSATEADFHSLVPAGELLGLRPDQVRVLQQFQPWVDGSPAAQLIGSHMTHLADCLAATQRADPLVGAWASTIDVPELELPDGATLTALTPGGDGLLAPDRLLARFDIDPPELAHAVSIRPNVALDPVLCAPPWPVDLDDTLSERTRKLLILIRHLIDALERSVSMPTLLQRVGPLDELAGQATTSVWNLVAFDSREQEADVRTSLAESDLNLASIRSDDGTFILLRINDNGDVVGRDIPEATPPEPSVPLGASVENVTLDAAAGWGLPDLVFRPKVVIKGSGLREIGDGTLVAGTKGIALQVKARDGATSDPTREANWLNKKAGEGLRQAHGTIRSTLTDPNLRLTNLRDHEVPLPGDTIDWVPVVVLDHPNPPPDVTPDREPDKHGLILLRRDWEFLWDQLRSVNAIIEYAHRVADERIELGTETTRYFDLADRDANAAPDPIAEWMADIGATQHSGPTLPQEPADTSDIIGHAVFQRILEDIAATDFTGDERARIEVLGLIDKFSVTHRAELGRMLLRRIDYCALSPADVLRAQHRVTFIDDGQLHLSFSVYSQLTGYHRQLFETWLLLRRQTFLERSNQQGPEYPWSVAVLLTPRPDGTRPWDTTVLATNSGPTYDDTEYQAIADAFSQDGTGDETIL